MQALEERLAAQLLRAQHQGDRIREVALARVEAKLGVLEAGQPQVERRLAELGGQLRGLADAVQVQIRRADQADGKLWEWRHLVEEELRGRLVGLEQRQHEAAFSAQELGARLTRLEHQNQLAPLEPPPRRCLGDPAGFPSERFRSLGAQLRDLELGAAFAPAPAPAPAQPEAGRGLRSPEAPRLPPVVEEPHAGDGLAALQGGLEQVHERVREAVASALDAHSRLEAQEERLRCLRTLADANEERARAARVHERDWERRAKELHRMQREVASLCRGHDEHLEDLERRVRHREQEADELVARLERLCSRITQAVPPPPPPRPSAAPAVEGEERQPTRSEAARLKEVEARLSALGDEVRALRLDAGLRSDAAPQLALLVDGLGRLAPKVMEHGQGLRRVEEQVVHLSAKVATLARVTVANAGDMQGKLSSSAGPGGAEGEGHRPLAGAAGSFLDPLAAEKGGA